MIKKLSENVAAELFREIYKDFPKRNLLIKDDSQFGWKVSGVFPTIGSHDLLIYNIQTRSVLTSFISIIRNYYKSNQQAAFFFLQEEYVGDSKSTDLECDLSSLDEIVNIVDSMPSINAILFDSCLSWVLKFHFEMFGYFSGNHELWNDLRNSKLSHMLAVPIWED